ncbi:MAG: sigma-70 family RNA polymerase sigma factor [Euzebyaceae bacterium]|nr:sigma-70 family RNA polymerase sigma factor [Euzebyaceae bacterium]
MAQDDVVALTPLIRRVVAARVHDKEAVADLTQETITRIMQVRGRLQDDAVTPYAIVTARNLVVSHARAERRLQRYAPRLVEHRLTASPEDEVVSSEERAAVRAALQTLSPRDRQAIVAHEVTGTGTAALADEQDSTPGAVAVRMARSRGKLRVEYLLAVGRVQLPTARCKPVLLALSVGDRRRQEALNAGAHLLTCAVCADLSSALLRRRIPAASLFPAGVVSAWEFVTDLVRRHPAQSVTAVTAAAALATAVALLPAQPAPSGQPAAQPQPASAQRATCAPASQGSTSGEPVVLDNRLLAGMGRAEAERLAGCTVRGERMIVRSVAANEGFWVSASPGGARVWVQLTRRRSESSRRVESGQRLSFEGVLRPHGPGFARRVGVTGPEDADELRRLGHHLAVPAGDLRN